MHLVLRATITRVIHRSFSQKLCYTEPKYVLGRFCGPLETDSIINSCEKIVQCVCVFFFFFFNYCVGSNCTNIEKFSAEKLLADELETLAEENSTEDTDY